MVKSRILMYPILYKLHHLSRNCRDHLDMYFLHLLHPIFTITALNIVKIFILSLNCAFDYSLQYFYCSCLSVVGHTFSAKLITLFFCLTSGYHCPFRKTPFPHSIQELHDDQYPKRQSGRELHDNHDCNTLSREKEYWRMLVLLSGALSLSFNVSLCNSVEGPGWVSIFSAGLEYAFRLEYTLQNSHLWVIHQHCNYPFENWFHIYRMV